MLAVLLLFLLIVILLYALHLMQINPFAPAPCPFCHARNWLAHKIANKLFAYARQKIAENPTLATKVAAMLGDQSAQLVDAVFDPGSPYRTDAATAPIAIASGAMPSFPQMNPVLTTQIFLAAPAEKISAVIAHLESDHTALMTLTPGIQHPADCPTCKLIEEAKQALQYANAPFPVPPASA